MNSQPTVIVLAEPPPAASWSRVDNPPAMAPYGAVDTTLRRALSSGLPVLLAATADESAEALKLLPRDDILTVPAPPTLQPRVDWLVHCIAAAVMARPQADGWLLLPADMPMLQSNTLQALAQGMHGPRSGPIVFPSHRHMRGHPIGFSAELYSELIRLNSEQDLRRLAARYPSVDVEVDDPGVHLAPDAQAGLSQLRTLLTGSHIPLRNPQARLRPHT